MSAIEAGSWTDRLLVWVREHGELSALVCFFLGFAESLVVVSIFVPSTVLFLGIGTAQSAAGGPFWPLWLAGSAGAFAGDVVSYAVGRHYKDQISSCWPFTRYPDLLQKSRGMFARWGWATIVLGKFVGGLRPFLPVAAGMVRMPWPVFLTSSAISCLLWAAVFLAPGFGLALLLR